MTTHAFRSLLALVVLFIGLVVPADAGGPLALRAPGQPFRWPNGGLMIPFNPDQGGLGPLTNAQAVAQTTAAFAAWEAIPSASATHVNAGMLAVDVDETNFMPFLAPAAPDGLSAIVYDEDGAIFNLLFGPGAGVLGFAGPEWVNTATGEIVEGVAFMNGGSLLGMNAFPVAEFLSVQVHEFGHYQNLAHTVVNGQAAGFGDATGPTPFNTFPRPSFLNRIETMYPFLFVNGGQATPHADDIAFFSFLYPEPAFALTGTIAGRIRAPNNTTPVTGVNVIARNIANPFEDAVSAISSDFATNFAPGQPFVGVYTLRGLTPGASYAVFVDQILAGGFSTPPRGLPGPEEFYNGANESNDFFADVPSVFTPVVPAAGVPVTGIDIIFNRLPPGPIPLGDDTSFEIFTHFPVRFCGQTYESVWVNANGSLTFGAGSSAFAESARAMLTGPPRIAGLFDDLNPAAGGSVSFEETNHSLTVHYTEVPEYPNVGANTFTIAVQRTPFDGSSGFALHGGLFTLDYGTLSATGGAAGYSCGGKVTSNFELETDLSRLRLPVVIGLERPAIYEVFTAADNDLDGARFAGLTPKPFRDAFEPNNAPTAAQFVKLPFSTEAVFTAIDPGDVDFYRFTAKAGDIVAIETVPGTQLDTMLGLFDASNNLLRLDDDGGAYGVGGLSRILVRIPVAGNYKVGVTTWPDFTFTGTGFESGRYVLSIRSYTGTLLPVTDDGSVEVPLTTFQFPFHGTSWSSVFVNGNGNLTFGAGNADFSETVPELLNGPPRIAPLWDDLAATSPGPAFTLQGLVIAEETPGALKVHFVSVPEFLTTGTNYFTTTIDSKGGVAFDYAATNRSDGLVGISKGGGVADPGPTDLSRAPGLSAATPAIYETFLGSFFAYGGVDLSFESVSFKKP
jgi:Bacterial pre-peptidase C-terminal domain